MANQSDYSFKILEEILTLRDYENREDVLHTAQIMLDIANNNEKCSNELKASYLEAYKKLDSLSFDEMKEIINILKSDDED